MTNARGELTDIEARQLRDVHKALRQLAETVEAPGVLAGVRLALADLTPALEGAALEFEFYTHLWDDEQTDADQRLAS